jgi:hypothetical protein
MVLNLLPAFIMFLVGGRITSSALDARMETDREHGHKAQPKSWKKKNTLAKFTFKIRVVLNRFALVADPKSEPRNLLVSSFSICY